jgi:RNA polymerase sigma-70 factor, ECF subfamily
VSTLADTRVHDAAGTGRPDAGILIGRTIRVMDPPPSPTRGVSRAFLADPGTEAALVDRLTAGDDAALGRVYDLHCALVYGLAKSVSHDEQIAREVTQDVFTHLWEFPDRVDLRRGSLKSYLGVMAHRRAVDAVRRSERHARTQERMRSAGETAAPASDAQVIDDTARTWQRERLAALLEGLPSDQREALRLAYFEGCTYRQVAAELGIPEGTAKSRLRLALAHLREQLGHDDRWAWT